MISFSAGRLTAVSAAAVLMLIGTGCATKKHVRSVVGPVESRVSQAEKRNAEQEAALGELGNNVARADERAMDADRKAVAAGESARQAGEAAQMARSRADQSMSVAESTRSRLNEVASNIDNYKLVTAENILFGLNRHTLTSKAKEQLDAAAAQLQNAPNYVLEIQGFTDSTGSAAANLELSRRRADAVVRYLTMQHNVPLRKINVLGVGEEHAEAGTKGREARKQARRVEIKVYSLDLGGTQEGAATTGSVHQTPHSDGVAAQQR